jgi:hypothetical protein
MSMNEYQFDIEFSEIEHDLEEVLGRLRTLLRQVHLAHCPTCRAEEEQSKTPTPPVVH